MEPWLAMLRPAFPRLSLANCRLTSPADDGYNCIAWAAENSERWWWPDPLHQSYWPAAVPRVVTLDAFVQAFSSLGYNQHSDGALEPGLQKLAIFANAEGKPTHAARQLPDGWWASKLGSQIDIEHELAAVDGPAYGTAVIMLARPMPG